MHIIRVKKTCHDCGVEEGQLHDYGCDWERCPFCGGQLIGCSCKYTKQGFDYNWNKEPYCGLPKEIFENGLPPELDKKWEDMLFKKGRVPYIYYPNICGKCGAVNPELFMVPDKEWNYYIEKNERKQVICHECYDYIKRVIDENK